MSKPADIISIACDVFVSYAHEQETFVRRLCKSLEERGQRVWVDWVGIPPSAAWMHEIEQAIVNSNAFVFVVSPDAAASEVCAQEVAFAAMHNKKLIPLMICDTEPDKLPAAVASRQWINFSPPADFADACEKLQSALETDLEWVRQHTRLLDTSLRWQHQPAIDTLLIGSELLLAEAWLSQSASHQLPATASQSDYIACSRWHAQRLDAQGYYKRGMQARKQGLSQAAAAWWLRAVETAPPANVPNAWPLDSDEPAWAEDAWTAYRLGSADRARLRARYHNNHPITCLAVDAQGSTAASGNEVGEITLWDLNNTNAVPVHFDAHAGAVSALAFDANGQVVTGGVDGKVRCWSVPGRSARTVLAGAAPATALTATPDGGLAVGLHTGHVIMLDASGQRVFNKSLHSGSVTTITFQDGSAVLISGSGRPAIGDSLAAGTAAAWRFADERATTLLPGTLDGRVLAVAVHAASDRAARSVAGGRIEIWDSSTLRPVTEWRADASAGCLTFATDGALVAGQDNGSIVYYEPRNWREIRRIDGHLSAITSIAQAGPHLWLSADNAGSVAIWDLATPATETIVHHGCASLAIDTTSGRAALGGDDGQIVFWDTNSHSIAHVIPAASGEITSVAITADGQHVLSGDTNGALSLWNAGTGHRKWCATGHAATVWSVAFHAAGQSAVSAAGDGSLVVWDVPGGEPRLTLDGHPDRIYGATFVDAERIVSASPGGGVRLWDASTGSQLQVLNAHKGLLGHRIRRLEYSRIAIFGDLLVAGTDDGAIVVWNLASGLIEREFAAHPQSIAAIAIDPGGKRILSGSLDNTAAWWDLETGKLLNRLQQHSDSIYGVAVLPDGRALTASMDNVVAAWNPDTGEVLGACIGHSMGVTSLASSTDGKIIASGSIDGTVRIWSSADWYQLQVLKTGHQGAVDAVAFSDDGAWLASAGSDNTLQMWRTHDYTQQLRKELDTPATALAFTGSQPELLVATADRQALVGNAGAFGSGGKALDKVPGVGGVMLWTPASDAHFLERHEGAVRAVAIAADASFALSGGDDATLRVWDPDAARQIRWMNGHESGVWAMALSIDGNTVVSASLDWTIRLWDLATGETTMILKGHKAGVGGLALDAGSTRLISVSADKTVRVWDLETGDQTACLEGHNAAVLCVGASADGRIAVSGSTTGELIVWDIDRAIERRRLAGHRDSVSSVGVTADGALAVSASADGTACTWDLVTGELLHEFTAYDTPATYSYGDAAESVAAAGDVPCHSVALHPNRAIAAIGYEDYAIRLWDLESGQRLQILTGHWFSVDTLAFSACGEFLISGDLQGHIFVWSPDKEDPLRALHGHRGDTLAALYHPGGTAIIGGEGGDLRLWDTTTGREMRHFTGHSAPVTAIAIHPLVNTIATASMDGSIRLWRGSSNKPVRVLSGHTGPVVSITFGQSPRMLFSASADGTVRAWNAETGELLQTYGQPARPMDIPLVSDQGMNLQLAFPGNAPTAVAVMPDNERQLLLTTNTGAELLSLVTDDTPDQPPGADGFTALYTIVGLAPAEADNNHLTLAFSLLAGQS